MEAGEVSASHHAGKENVGNDDFIARDYQAQLTEQALERNTILFLPTGSGKTFISVLAIKLKFAELERPFVDGGKRSFFLVNTVALVDQQALVLERHLHLEEVGRYSGDMNIDFWEKKTWYQEFIRYKVLVMTCEIFLQLLLKGFLTLKQVSVLVFDECHHATEDHPMAQIMVRFADTPVQDQPRVLGLTATLLNKNPKFGKVEGEVHKLEVTLRSKIATVDNYSVVERFSTKPKEQFVSYSAHHDDCENIIDQTVAAAMNLCTNFDLRSKTLIEDPNPKCSVIVTSKQANLKKFLMQVTTQHRSLGMFGASKTALANICTLENHKHQTEDKSMHSMISSLICSLIVLRKHLEYKMRSHNAVAHPFLYSSNKVRTLLMLLKRHYGDSKESDRSTDEAMQVLVFVQERITAKILCSVLKSAASMEDFNFIKPVFMVGGNCNPVNETWEGAFLRSTNEDAIQRFRSGESNVMVCSDVLEEGIDIPLCNLVIKFDPVMTFRSYIQSKGRARHKSSRFYLMVEKELEEKYMDRIKTYGLIEDKLKKMLVGSSDLRDDPTEEEIMLACQEDLPPYFTGTSTVTMTSSIPILNTYCMSLSRDRFTQIAPTWRRKNVTTHWSGEEKIQVVLKLPSLAPVTQVVEGVPMRNIKLAKRAAALEMCKVLHRCGELDENLQSNKNSMTEEEERHFLPLWDAFDSNQGGQPGTKGRIRPYSIVEPKCLTGAVPLPHKDTYVHLIEMKVQPANPNLSHRIKTTRSVMAAGADFAILSSKIMPDVCNFSVYMDIGEVQIKIVPCITKISLTEYQLQKLRVFHHRLFTAILRASKKFLCHSHQNEGRCYLLAPMKQGGGVGAVDWEVVDREIPKVEKQEAQETNWQSKQFENQIILPWHRGQAVEQVYLVTEVLSQLSAHSKFPPKRTYDKEEADCKMTYKDYFLSKYNIELKHPEWPLLCVRPIKLKSNCLLPREQKPSHGEEFGEHVPPELCVRLLFPAGLWLKAVCLPSALHRLERLLVAEDLRCTIFSEIGCGVKQLPVGELTPAEDYVKTKECQVQQRIFRTKESKKPFVARNPTKPWGSLKEPVDIERNFESVTENEMREYVQFTTKSSRSDISPYKAQNKKKGNALNLPPLKSGEGIIKLLNCNSAPGPNQAKLYQALTTHSSCDLVNLERLETLGDSFLKLISSVFLFMRFPDSAEGKLTYTKGKIIGNRHLFYCGREKFLGGRLKALNIIPFDNWIPPCYQVPKELLSLVEEKQLCSLLFKVRLTEEEVLSGIVSQQTINTLEHDLQELNPDILDSYAKKTTADVVLGRHCVPDKTVADCVEALIGAYIEGSGVNGGLKILGWLQILPEISTLKTGEQLSLYSLLTGEVPSPLRLKSNSDCLLFESDIKGLQECLGYKFNNLAFLLEALTHPSFVYNSVTYPYERLEFIGDAVLDFLVTAYIYENCGQLNPGELTDLRSALVNNVTFACLTVRYGFQKFLLCNSPALLEAIDMFVLFQETRKHVVDDEVLILLEEAECHISDSIEVPKALGDIFESLAGAVFLDSGKNLTIVWKVFYRLMKKEIDAFSKKVPMQLVRQLYEIVGNPSRIKFRSITVPSSSQVMVELTVTIDTEVMHFNGFGENKKKAKKSAAKLAIRHLQLVEK